MDSKLLWVVVALQMVGIYLQHANHPAFLATFVSFTIEKDML